LPRGAAQATTIDLSSNLNGALNGAVFLQFDPYNGAGAGSGNIDSFVRYDGPGQRPGMPPGVKEGYNVDVASSSDFQYDELWGQFTHSLVLDDVPVVQFGGTAYREFVFDINETGGSGSVLSLDTVEVYLADRGNLLGDPTFPPGNVASLGYDMDAGDISNFVLLDGAVSGSGSGKFDMLLLVPEAFFAGADPSDYVILYSKVGGEGGLLGNDDGYNEWSVSMVGGVIPEPGTFSLVALGLVSLAVSRRRTR
jgi:hypothetical protein